MLAFAVATGPRKVFAPGVANSFEDLGSMLALGAMHSLVLGVPTAVLLRARHWNSYGSYALPGALAVGMPYGLIFGRLTGTLLMAAVNPTSFEEIGSTTTTRCLDPTLSGVVDESGPFACGEVLASSSGGEREDTPTTRQLVAPIAWIWDGYRTTPDGGIESLPAGLIYSVGFETNGSYGGLANCIGYAGTWTNREGTLATDPGNRDAADCDDVDTTGALFFGTLESDSDSSFTIDDDRLSITSTDGTTLFFSEGDELFPDTN